MSEQESIAKAVTWRQAFKEFANLHGYTEGNPLELGTWSGGSDSGSVDLDLPEELESFAEQFEDEICSPWGSFAGEYSTEGTIRLTDAGVSADGSQQDYTSYDEIDEDILHVPVSAAFAEALVEVVVPSGYFDTEGAIPPAEELDESIDIIFKDGPTPSDYASVLATVRAFVQESWESLDGNFVSICVPEVRREEGTTGAHYLELVAMGCVYETSDDSYFYAFDEEPDGN